MTASKVAEGLGLEADDALVREALTHRSAGSPSYERLEFLGDRVLNLAVAAWLMARFPQATEGELSLWHTQLVRAETCAAVGEAWGVPEALRASGALKPGMVADAVEALLGALYLRQGMAAVQRVVEAAFGMRLGSTPEQFKDAKTTLQERLQAQGHDLPVYTLVAQHGPDHAAAFTMRVTCALGTVEGKGASKAAASMAAAENLLKGLTHDGQ